MQKIILATINCGSLLLVAIGVFIFANALSGKSFSVGNIKFPAGADAGMFFIALGLILFAVSFFANKISRKKL